MKEEEGEGKTNIEMKSLSVTQCTIPTSLLVMWKPLLFPVLFVDYKLVYNQPHHLYKDQHHTLLSDYVNQPCLSYIPQSKTTFYHFLCDQFCNYCK